MKVIFLGAVLLVSLSACLVRKRPLLRVPGYGILLGETGRSELNQRNFYSFFALRYAKEPTNETRFLPPVPVDPMVEGEVYDAGNKTVLCPQDSGGSEDCLMVNIFTPELPRHTLDEGPLLPVMFWIHGGGFYVGSASRYDPSKLMDEDVVLVMVQYRLGPLGFLSLDTDEVPGNASLFDVLEALRWVQKYIRYFGGDSNLVTIAGHSAGGATVSHLMLSPLAKGLFHRVIGQSGAAPIEWAFDRNGRAHSLRIAELAGCPLEPYSALLNCLRSTDARNLVSARTAYEAEYQKQGYYGFKGSSPVVQKAGAIKFLEREPLELLESGEYNSDVPILFGANKHEGVAVIASMFNSFLVRPNNVTRSTDFIKEGLVPFLQKALGVRDDTGAIVNAILDKYLEGADLSSFDDMLAGIVDMLGVFFVKAAAYRQVQLHSLHNPGNAYWYSFDFIGRYSLLPYQYPGQNLPLWHGAGHSDELIYLLPYPFSMGLNETERTLSTQMIQLWTNFAKYGNPTPEGVELLEGIPQWPALSIDGPTYMSLDKVLQIKCDYTREYTVAGDEAYERPNKAKRPSLLLQGKLP